MSENAEGRVAVYIDFDNVVISRYDQVFGDGEWRRDRVYSHTGRGSSDSKVAGRIREATVDISAVLDYATSFGTIVLSRAYADWSVPVNAGYRDQLIEKAVDLVQLFPTVRSLKNGADIRLAVDVVEDLFRLPDLSHVVIVGGDSDYIALAQRAKRLGRHVVGIGISGRSSRALAAACDEFSSYDSLPGVGVDVDEYDDEDEESPAGETAEAAEGETASEGSPQRRRPSKLLVQAVQLLAAKQDQEWLNNSTVKNQMVRLDPSFSESSEGYGSFTDFLKSRGNLVELRDTDGVRMLRLRPAKRAREK